MGYFNHAYQKAFYMADHIVDNTKGPADLTTAGDLALINVDTYTDLSAAATIAAYKCIPGATEISELTGAYIAAADLPGGADESGYFQGSPKKFLIAQGSFRNASSATVKDILGGNPLHGGYLESVKSKDIQFRHINMMKEINGNAGTSQVAEIVIMSAANSKSCFPCGSSPQLRIDIKGADALRLLGHNAYRNVMFSAKCDCCNAADTTPAGSFLDVKKVVNEWAKEIARDPILSKMIDTTQADFFSVTTNTGGAWADYAISTANNTATSAYDAVACEDTWDAADGARLKLYMGVVDTTFGTCSFDTRDWTNVEPLLVHADILDDSGDTCDICENEEILLTGDTINNGVDPTTNGKLLFRYNGTATGGDPATESVAPVQEMGNGVKALNDILLTENYRQNPFSQGASNSSRIREIEGSKDVLDTFSSTAQYYQFKLQHVVPRFNNPSGMFDNDQYLYTIYALDGNAADIGTLSDMFDRIALHAGVTNETV